MVDKMTEQANNGFTVDASNRSEVIAILKEQLKRFDSGGTEISGTSLLNDYISKRDDILKHKNCLGATK